MFHVALLYTGLLFFVVGFVAPVLWVRLVAVAVGTACLCVWHHGLEAAISKNSGSD